VDEIHWVEVSLEVSPELAEAVAEVIGRFTREGVVIEQKACLTSNQEENLEENLMENQVRVFGYFFADASLEERKQRLEEALWHLGQIQSLPDARYRLIKDQDWMTAWKDQYKPLQIGQRLMIIPAWWKEDFPQRLPIRINPGMAFGTGTHPTTQLSLMLIEKHLQTGQCMFDIGCGSGILSIAALKLGAERVYAVDTDPASIASTKQNCELNHVQNRIEISQGSTALITSGHFSILQAPLVVANILASVILELLENDLTDLVEKQGLLILSGILENQCEAVINKARQFGLVLLEKKEIEDWAALCFQHPAAL